MNLDFDVDRPCVGVFCYAVRAEEYWDRVVVRPAQTFLARGGGGKRVSKRDAEDTQYGEGASSAMHRNPGEGQSKTAKRRQRDKAAIQSLQSSASGSKYPMAPWNAGNKQPAAKQRKDEGGGGHPERLGRGSRQRDRDANQICFAFVQILVRISGRMPASTALVLTLTPSAGGVGRARKVAAVVGRTSDRRRKWPQSF